MRILLAGGTSESAPIAAALLAEGHELTVSLATEAGLELPRHPALSERRGRLDRHGFAELLSERRFDLVVDASHPFAAALRRELSWACAATGTRRIRFEREGTADLGQAETVPDHETAAVLAASDGRPILLTTGCRVLEPYVRAARLAGRLLHARVLPAEESRIACRAAGIPEERLEFARGPFGVEQTRDLLRRWNIGVLVAKDGGTASGIAERLEAARLENVRVVVVRRPEPESDSAGTVSGLVEAIRKPELPRSDGEGKARRSADSADREVHLEGSRGMCDDSPRGGIFRP